MSFSAGSMTRVKVLDSKWISKTRPWRKFSKNRKFGASQNTIKESAFGGCSMSAVLIFSFERVLLRI